MGWWVAVVVILVAAPAGHWLALRGRTGAVRVALLLLALAVPLGVVFPVAGSPALRFFLGMAALMSFARAVELACGRLHDPRSAETWYRYLVAHSVVPDVTWPRSPADAARTRRAGARRIGRGLAKQVAALGFVALATAVPDLRGNLLAASFWAMWVLYFGITSCVDVACGLVMLTGLGVAEAFDSPPLADSPRDFWSRRWNLVFRTIAHRNVFVPLGAARRPLLAAAAVFVASAAAHEYLVLVSLGTTRGHMAAFFLLHGLVTITYVELRRTRGRDFMPRAAAVPLHVVWLAATAPLFFAPLLQIIPLTALRLW